MIHTWLREHVPGLRSRRTRIRECRHCGQAVDPARETCPACGHTGIATYELR